MRLRPAQVLIELTIALAVAMVAILALVQSATKSVSNSTFSKNQSQATAYTSEAVEWLRSEKNKSWPDFLNHTPSPRIYCLATLDWNTASACVATTIAGTNFVRELNIVNGQLTVSVAWQEGGKSFSTKQSIVFNKY